MVNNMNDKERTCNDCCCFQEPEVITDNYGYCQYFDTDMNSYEKTCAMYDQLNGLLNE